MESTSEVEWPEAVMPAAIALNFPVGEPSASAPAKVPRRIRRRLLERRSSPPASVEEIEAKLKDADLRRQQFHDWLSSKARLKPRSPSWSSQEEDLGQRLEARLFAAKQKRLSLLAKAQMRLARLDELRQAARTDVEMRFEKECKELGTRVESRVQQAEANRMHLFKARMQRRAAAQERTARSLLQRIIRENKNKEYVRSAIFQKRAAAEKKRLGLLEAERKRAHARVMQAHQVAKTVYHQRESERRRLKEQLENRLQRAKRQRAEYLKQRGSPHSSARIKLSKQGDFLSRKLAGCWRWFARTRKSTFALAKAYVALKINENSVKSVPFEQLALHIASTITLQTVKPLLDRLESRFLLSQSSGSSNPENIDHLLKHLASPNRRVPSGKVTRARGVTKKGAKSFESNKLSRYPVRVVLCAYMILGHPNAVFSGQGESEVALMESAVNFVREFELLIKVMLHGPNSARSSGQSSPSVISDDLDHHQESAAQSPHQQTVKSHLAAFDSAWRSYLYCFVVWKVKDARSLEEDLVRAACQLELSMMQTCKVNSEGKIRDPSPDILKQVTEDQKLLRENVQHLSGDAGIERMECALSDTRSKFFEAKENGSPLATPIAHIASPSTSNSSGQPLVSKSEEQAVVNDGRSNHVVHSLLGSASSSQCRASRNTESSTMGRQLPTENELLVNEILHGGYDTFTNKLGIDVREETGIKAKVRETIEKAFWDGIMHAMEDEHDYSRIVGLVKEVRDELCELAPHSWEQEILDSIDLEILSQVLDSGTQDTVYLGQILEHALVMLEKLSAPANEDEMKKTHRKLLSELAEITQLNDKQHGSFVIATIKGLRFVLEQIQKLKKEISKAHIQLMEPIIKGSAGLEYLQKAFADRYGPPSEAASSLPLTVQWISSLRNNLEEEWNEHVDSLSVLSTSHGFPLVSALRTCGGTPMASKQGHILIYASGGEELPECSGEKIDKLLRFGILKLSCAIEGLTIETVPETFKLNVMRLRSVQSQHQQIIVIATSILVLRQILVSESSALSPSDLERTISDTVKRLSELLAHVPDVGLEEIIETMVNSSSSLCPTSETKLQSRKEMMARVLTKSLQNNDGVFVRVSRSIYLAARGVVFGGSGAQGRKLADAALRRVGAALLLDQVLQVAEALIVLATISGHVHGPWYRCLV